MFTSQKRYFLLKLEKNLAMGNSNIYPILKEHVGIGEEHFWYINVHVY